MMNISKCLKGSVLTKADPILRVDQEGNLHGFAPEIVISPDKTKYKDENAYNAHMSSLLSKGYYNAADYLRDNKFLGYYPAMQALNEEVARQQEKRRAILHAQAVSKKEGYLGLAKFMAGLTAAPAFSVLGSAIPEVVNGIQTAMTSPLGQAAGKTLDVMGVGYAAKNYPEFVNSLYTTFTNPSWDNGLNSANEAVETFLPLLGIRNLAKDISRTLPTIQRQISALRAPKVVEAINDFPVVAPHPALDYTVNRHGLQSELLDDFVNITKLYKNLPEYESRLRNAILLYPEYQKYSLEDLIPELKYTNGNIHQAISLNLINNAKNNNNFLMSRIINDLLKQNTPTGSGILLDSPIWKHLKPEIYNRIVLTPQEQSFILGLNFSRWNPINNEKFLILMENKPFAFYPDEALALKHRMVSSRNYGLPAEQWHLNPEVYDKSLDLNYFKGNTQDIPITVGSSRTLVKKGLLGRRRGALTSGDLDAISQNPELLKRLERHSSLINLEGTLGAPGGKFTPLEFVSHKIQNLRNYMSDYLKQKNFYYNPKLTLKEQLIGKSGKDGERLLGWERILGHRYARRNEPVSGLIIQPRSLSLDSYPLWEKRNLQQVKSGDVIIVGNGKFINNDWAKDALQEADANIISWLKSNKGANLDDIVNRLELLSNGSILNRYFDANNNPIGTIRELPDSEILSNFNAGRHKRYRTTFGEDWEKYYPGDATLTDIPHRFNIPYSKFLVRKNGGTLNKLTPKM